ncbi:unnamed protein product [Musa acuminata subsp. malaccensis]|uniref:(wild Malaysian banana) hypothetical protein n=1 Tax=Musa acuminata subsp. malaccensis TaxID=214687 RepID=A0A804J9E9_MUSAM|nr:unnamed protein product [Musa acuminata subsp. malaccensis]
MVFLLLLVLLLKTMCPNKNVRFRWDAVLIGLSMFKQKT